MLTLLLNFADEAKEEWKVKKRSKSCRFIAAINGRDWSWVDCGQGTVFDWGLTMRAVEWDISNWTGSYEREGIKFVAS